MKVSKNQKNPGSSDYHYPDYEVVSQLVTFRDENVMEALGRAYAYLHIMNEMDSLQGHGNIIISCFYDNDSAEWCVSFNAHFMHQLYFNVERIMKEQKDG